MHERIAMTDDELRQEIMTRFGRPKGQTWQMAAWAHRVGLFLLGIQHTPPTVDLPSQIDAEIEALARMTGDHTKPPPDRTGFQRSKESEVESG